MLKIHQIPERVLLEHLSQRALEMALGCCWWCFEMELICCKDCQTFLVTRHKYQLSSLFLLQVKQTFSVRTQGKSMKLSWGRFRLEIRKMFLPCRVLEHWTGSPGQWSLQQELKKHLDNTLGHRVWFLWCPVQGQELDSMTLKGVCWLSIFLQARLHLPGCF